MGAGEAIEIYKEVGYPTDVSRRFDLAHMTGTHAIGHTRMATEVGRDDARRASLLDRPRPVPRAQRLAVEPQQPAPRARSTTA